MGGKTVLKLTFNSCIVSQSSVRSLTPSQSLKETLSTSHRARVLIQVPARLVMVLSRVMYVPPMEGSLILAWNAITDTNMEYANTCDQCDEKTREKMASNAEEGMTTTTYLVNNKHSYNDDVIVEREFPIYTNPRCPPHKSSKQ